MNLSKELFQYKSNEFKKWESTTLTEIGKNEEFLEDIIAKNPEIIGFDAIQEGIYGPFRTYRQISFNISQGRKVIPDVVILSASGHIILVEVKKYGNPELNDRRVISQILDYASAFAQKSKEEIYSIFIKENINWYEFIKKEFPEIDDYEVLADVFINKFNSGNLNMIIACDKLPHGLKEIVEGICTQSAVDYKLDVLEITPYIINENKEEIFFVPKPRITTTVIGRTVVNIDFLNTNNKLPVINIQTTSLDEIEENVREIEKGRKGRYWSDEELKEIYENNDNEILRNIFEFTFKESYSRKINSDGIKINPAFGFYVSGKRIDNNDTRIIQLFGYKSANESIRIYFNMFATIIESEVLNEFKTKISRLFYIDVENKAELNIPISLLKDKEDEFKRIVLWVKDKCKDFTR